LPGGFKDRRRSHVAGAHDVEGRTARISRTLAQQLAYHAWPARAPAARRSALARIWRYDTAGGGGAVERARRPDA